jgi:hypothetical protein
MRLDPRVLILCGALAGAATVQAGPVDVSFANATRMSDAGATPSDEQANLKAIAQHLRSLGQRYVGAGQTLKIEVTDVDLAGENKLLRRRIGEMRVARGGADIPKISLRYKLQAGGQVLKEGEETITDLDYLRRPNHYGPADPLAHEKQMLDNWFKTRFAAP